MSHPKQLPNANLDRYRVTNLISVNDLRKTFEGPPIKSPKICKRYTQQQTTRHNKLENTNLKSHPCLTEFLDIIHRPVFFYLKTQCFGDWSLPTSSGKRLLSWDQSTELVSV
jgi:hypothetical protein